MRRESIYCDWCKKFIPVRGNGVTITLGYSQGGWGNRQNVAKFTDDDVCDECFNRYMELAPKFVEKLLNTKTVDNS